MTLEDWLTQFAAEAAALPGWSLRDGLLRRHTPAVLSHDECPLRAQWNVHHPETPCVSNATRALLHVWGDALTLTEIRRLMDAADQEAFPPGRDLMALRHRLLAACGLAPQETPDADA